MTYPQQGQPGDPYQQQPGSQPPGGYAPGQAGSEYPPQYTQPDMGQSGYPPPPGYGQPDPYGQQPGYGQQPPPGYGPGPGQPGPYGQYGPPPVQPTSNGGAGTAILIVVVLMLLVGGGAAGYFLLGGNEEGSTTAGDDMTEEAAPSDDEEPSEQEPTDEDGTEPSGDSLIVDSLGANTPLPSGGEWQPRFGPGATGALSDDAQAITVQHTSTWISYMEVGRVNTLYLDYDPADLQASAGSAIDAWIGSTAFDSTEDLEIADTEFTDVEVDGRPAVLAQSQVSWTSSPNTEDLYEDIAIVVVDVDGVNGFIGIASVPESGTDFQQTTVDAFLATTFEGDSV